MLDKLENFINDLHENEYLSVVKDSLLENRRLLKYSNPEKSFEEVYDKTKIKVPKEDWKYEDLGCLSLDWSATTNIPNEEYLWGGFALYDFSSVLWSQSYFWDIYNNDSRFWENNSQPEAEAVWRELLPKLNCFHKSGHGDDGTYGCILREEGVYPCPIYFFDSGIWFKMDMSLKEYYDTIIACKAVYYWQYFYIDTQEIVKKLGNYKPRYVEADAYYFNGPKPFLDKFEDGTFTYSAEGILHQMKNIIKRFPKLFPDVDLSYFKEKCQALEKALNS